MIRWDWLSFGFRHIPVAPVLGAIRVCDIKVEDCGVRRFGAATVSTYVVEFVLPLAGYFSRCAFGPVFMGLASMFAWATNYFGLEPVWFRLRRVRECACDCSTYAEKMAVPLTAIAQDFSSSGIVSAIRAAQMDTIRFPEFVKRATAAGIISYWAFLTGKKVIYFGRKGEVHVEEFPRASSPPPSSPR